MYQTVDSPPGSAVGARPVATRPQPQFRTRQLGKALGAGVLGSALVGAPASYTAVVALTNVIGAEADRGLALRALLVTVVVLAGPLIAMSAFTPRALRRRWLPVHLGLELVIVICIGSFAAAYFG